MAAFKNNTFNFNMGDRSFSVAAARVWNSLPSDITSATSLLAFRRVLKTELFCRSFSDN